MGAPDALRRPQQSPQRASIGDEYRYRVMKLRDELAGILGVTTKMIGEINGLVEDGGTLSIQPQLNFITGALMRIQKDAGITEHLQKHGATLRRAVKL